MKIDGIAASQHLDSSGELLHISGHDITDLIEGKGQLNWEHKSDSPEDIIGQVIFAKKIIKKEDCDTTRQEMFWDKVKGPFVYIIGELFDGEEHPGAVACAAMLRYCKKRKIPMIAGFSIEGSTLERQGHELKRSIGRRVAVTLRPCNKSAISDIYESDDIEKNMGWDVTPSYKTIEIDDVVFSDTLKTETPIEVIKSAIISLQKTLSAGNYNSSPSTLTQGSALQIEHVHGKKTEGLNENRRKKLSQILSKWDGKSALKSILKAALPDVSDDYLEHFEQVVSDIKLKKSENLINHLSNPNASFLQDSLAVASSEALPFIIQNKNILNKFEIIPGKKGKFLFKHPIHGTLMLKVADSEQKNKKFKDAVKYHEILKNFFMISGGSPNITFMQHPQLLNNVMLSIDVNNHSHVGSEDFHNALEKSRQTGKLQQIAIADLILGHPPRTWLDVSGNGGEIVHINNGPLFQYYKTSAYPSDYYSDSINLMLGDDMIIPEVREWLNQLDPHNLYVYLINNTQTDQDSANMAKHRLEYLKKKSYGKTFYNIFKELNSESSIN